MAYKSCYVRIYAVHDYDLMKYCLSLRETNCEKRNYRNSVANIIKQVLRAYIREEEYIPPVVSQCVNILPKGTIRVNVRLHTEKDADIIDFVGRIRKRQRNSFLKNLLRRYIRDSSVLISYLEDMDVYETAIVGFPASERKKAHEVITAESRKSERKQLASLPEAETPTKVPKAPVEKEKQLMSMPDKEPGQTVRIVPEAEQEPGLEMDPDTDFDTNFDFFAALGQAMEGQ